MLIDLFLTPCQFATLNSFGPFLLSDNASCWGTTVTRMKKSKTSQEQEKISSQHDGKTDQDNPALPENQDSWLCSDSLLLLLQVLHHPVHQTQIRPSFMQRRHQENSPTLKEDLCMSSEVFAVTCGISIASIYIGTPFRSTFQGTFITRTLFAWD